MVVQDPAEDPHRLGQGTVGDHHIVPDNVEDLPARYDLGAPFEQENQEIEIAGDEWDVPPRPKKQSLPGGEDESGEPVPNGEGFRRV